MAINKVTTDVIDLSGNTGGLVWAKGATGDQPLPVDSVAGDMRENTTTGKTEVFNGTEWRNLKEAPVTIAVDYLVVAGGAGGGSNGGGGGAGGYRNSYNNEASGGNSVSEPSLSLLPGTPYTVEVGLGGAPRVYPSEYQFVGNNGSDSVFSSITSIGGGGGGSNNNLANSGGKQWWSRNY